MDTYTISRRMAKYFDFSANIIVPNVSWGLLSWEMDLAIVSKAGYLTEVEIKRSTADLRADKEKAKWTRHRKEFDRWVKSYVVVMPISLHGGKWRQHVEHFTKVIFIENDGTLHFAQGGRTNHKAEALSDKQVLQVARLGSMRYWSRDIAGEKLMQAIEQEENNDG